MRAGAKSLSIRNFTVTDDQKSRAPNSMPSGWFYVRALVQIPRPDLDALSQSHGITFESKDMIQPGWFKKYLDEEQTAYLRSSPNFALFAVKTFDKPAFPKLRGLQELTVMATEDWTPRAPATIKSKMFSGVYIVTGATAEQLFEDPKVVKIEEVAKIKLL